jgi:hypothetical protein
VPDQPEIVELVRSPSGRWKEGSTEYARRPDWVAAGWRVRRALLLPEGGDVVVVAMGREQLAAIEALYLEAQQLGYQPDGSLVSAMAALAQPERSDHGD